MYIYVYRIVLLLFFFLFVVVHCTYVWIINNPKRIRDYARTLCTTLSELNFPLFVNICSRVFNPLFR